MEQKYVSFLAQVPYYCFFSKNIDNFTHVTFDLKTYMNIKYIKI